MKREYMRVAKRVVMVKMYMDEHDPEMPPMFSSCNAIDRLMKVFGKKANEEQEEIVAMSDDYDPMKPWGEPKEIIFHVRDEPEFTKKLDEDPEFIYNKEEMSYEFWFVPKRLEKWFNRLLTIENCDLGGATDIPHDLYEWSRNIVIHRKPSGHRSRPKKY